MAQQQESCTKSKVKVGEAKNLAKKKSKTCNEAFSQYLLAISQQVNQSFYRDVLKFVLLYQQCLNLFGSQLVEKLQGTSHPTLVIPPSGGSK